MNRNALDILHTLFTKKFINQRLLARESGYSLGVVNRSLKILMQEGYLDDLKQITPQARLLAEELAPKRAIILAAGFGLRMVPLNREISKGLLKVRGDILIERLIRQLHAAGIKEIYVVVGFLKEKYEYLIDDYGVELIINPSYHTKNNLHSLHLVRDKLANAYIVPVDLYAKKNPFQKYEFYSSYMISDIVDDESEVRLNRKMELVRTKEDLAGNEMLGIAYLTPHDATIVRERLEKFVAKKEYNKLFWEETLYNKNKIFIPARVVHGRDVVEIDTYEELREFDRHADTLKSEVLTLIADFFETKTALIKNITPIKKGMTNRSFRFTLHHKKYIMRLPGVGSNRLIDRKAEKIVYEKIRPFGIADDVLYFDEKTGYKITRFIEGASVLDPQDKEAVKKCMTLLKKFHTLKIVGVPSFDIFLAIEFYESLLEGHPSVYRDYSKTKADVFSLKPLVEKYQEEKVLTHIDAVYDNFLFFQRDDKEEIRLIDWEYAALADPHLDIAMFALYALYEKEDIDFLIDSYFEDACPDEMRLKIYAYIALGGLLWSNWAEYKESQGMEFGEYALLQYRYAKDYYCLVANLLKEKETQDAQN